MMMENGEAKTYTVSGPKGVPLLGIFPALKRNVFAALMDNALHYGDIIPFTAVGQHGIQVNHPDFVRHVLLGNHKNYQKSKPYIRFQSAIGLGLLTSNGDKWRRDRQKIQPMFKREQVEGYYTEVVEDVGVKYKKRWESLTAHGPAEVNITKEMSAITLEIIVKIIFGKDNLSDETVLELQQSYSVFLDYLKNLRLIPNVDMDRLFHTRRHARFEAELKKVEAILQDLTEKYRRGALANKYNMLALLLDAQKENPTHFGPLDIRDHCVSMVFAGFESTSILMQWIWYVLDTRPDVAQKLRGEILQPDGMYFSAVFQETMRLYPPFWMTGREPIEDDEFGGYAIKKGVTILIPQIVMHRHPRWWDQPNSFIPERFLGAAGEAIDDGLFFPFSLGPRKCSGYKLVEMEAKTMFQCLLPYFRVTVLNSLGNGFDPAISLKPQFDLTGIITRI